ncbi:MAG TPA: glycosyltransferase [Solirubrobacteraceae bacterium]|nr:glycosyltransferase [Solirubrobacteraceae bacterium]
MPRVIGASLNNLTSLPITGAMALPSVSVLLCAYNYEQFVGRALESALAQDYPAELAEIIVIDDGSTDSTGEIVDEIADRNPGRVRIVHQANAGYIGATNRGLAESRGELIALLDADDVWRADKTRRQVEMFQSDPTLGLVFSDMTVVDADEAVLMPSKLTEYGEIGENRLAALLFENFATTSSIMVRASLRDAYAPVPAHVHAADWWIAMQVALRARLDYVPEPLALYRMHGTNMSVGGTGAALAENRRAIAWQLWALRNLPLDALDGEDMLHAWNGIERHARIGVEVGGSFFFDLMDRAPGDSEQADALLMEADNAAANGDSRAEARLTLKALAWDPFRLETRGRLHESARRAVAQEGLTDPLPGARPYRMLVDARELLEDDDMMSAYAEAMGGSDSVTLVIDASELPTEVAQAGLQRLVDRHRLNERHDIDLVAIVGPQEDGARRRLLQAVQARYSRHAGEPGRKPVLTPSSLGQVMARAA